MAADRRPAPVRSRRRQLLGLPALATVVATLVGTLLGGATMLAGTSGTGADDAWASVVWALTGVMVAGLSGLVLWVAGLLWAARRLFYHRQRAGAVWLAVAFGVASTAVSSAIFGAATALGMAGGVILAAGSPISVVMLLASGSLAFWLWGRRADDPTPVPSDQPPSFEPLSFEPLPFEPLPFEPPSAQPSGPASSAAAAGPQDPGG